MHVEPVRAPCRLEPARRGDRHVDAVAGPGEDQRIRHVVAIADVGEPDATKPSLVFENGHVVGNRLAGMAEVREAVDDRHARVLGHLFDDVVAERADHDALGHPIEVHGDVMDRLALAKIDLGLRERHREAAELLDADVEAHARPQRRFLENEGERPALERAGVFLRMPLHLAREADELTQLFVRKIADCQKVPATHGRAFPELDRENGTLRRGDERGATSILAPPRGRWRGAGGPPTRH